VYCRSLDVWISTPVVVDEVSTMGARPTTKISSLLTEVLATE
jgi:hypothetical protein